MVLLFYILYFERNNWDGIGMVSLKNNKSNYDLVFYLWFYCFIFCILREIIGIGLGWFLSKTINQIMIWYFIYGFYCFIFCILREIIGIGL